MSGFVGVFFPLDSAEFVSSFYGTTSMSDATQSAVTLILLQSTTRGNKKKQSADSTNRSWNRDKLWQRWEQTGRSAKCQQEFVGRWWESISERSKGRVIVRDWAWRHLRKKKKKLDMRSRKKNIMKLVCCKCRRGIWFYLSLCSNFVPLLYKIIFLYLRLWL